MIRQTITMEFPMQNPQIGQKRPCQGDSTGPCSEQAEFKNYVVVRKEKGSPDGLFLDPVSGPGWECPKGHRQLHSS